MHTILRFSLCVALSACTTADDPVRAYPIETLADAIGGPKAMAQPGDYVLQNEHARIAILGVRNSLGPGLHGGTMVDADLRNADPLAAPGLGNDQFAELFPTVNMNVTDPILPAEVAILADGSDGMEAVIRARGVSDPFLTLLGALWAILDAPDFYLWTDYIARPGESWFTIRTTVTTGTGGEPDPSPAEPIDYQTEPFPLIDWALETGIVLGDFLLQGGSIDVFVPGEGFDEDGLVYEAGLVDRNTFTDPFQFDFIAGVGPGVSYGLASKAGDIFLPLFTSSMTVAVGGGRDGDGTPQRFPPGQPMEYERYFFVGHGDVASILDQYLEARGIPYGTVTGNVLERVTQQPVSGISVLAYATYDEAEAEHRPYSQFGTDIHPQDVELDGSFHGRLPVGEWFLVAHEQGRPPSNPVKVDVLAGQDVKVALGVERHGILRYTIRDEIGRLVPAKLTVFHDDGQPSSIDPNAGDSFVAGSPEVVSFALYGSGEVALPPGRYRAVASRGVEYEIDESEPFTVSDIESAAVDLQVIRAVDTVGWIGADFHVHGEASFDSGVSQVSRIMTMAAEGVEFFTSSDHDHLVDYAPTVDALGMEQWIQTGIGNETTTLELGHFIGFPLAQDYLVEAGGGRDLVDWTDKVPQDIIDSLRLMGKNADHDPFVFVAHPRDGILGYFDQYGFDPYIGAPGEAGAPGEPGFSLSILNLGNELISPVNASWDFDGLELLNGKRFELIRTPTQPEMDAFAKGQNTVYDFFTRTLAEQDALAADEYRLSPDVQGQVDDWFTLLNLGFTFTALGNSDTHTLTAPEAGCPRNFVLLDEDDPAFIDDQAVADAVRAHRVVASYGPFLRMWVNGESIGSTLTAAEPVTVHIDVQAPRWIAVDRVELYANGSLTHEWTVEDNGDVMRFDETVTVETTTDTWFVAMAMGDGDLAPVFTPVEIPYVDLQEIVTGALAGAEAVADLVAAGPPIPTEYPIRPYALTNPIWIDRAGDGFDAPGVADWMIKP